MKSLIYGLMAIAIFSMTSCSENYSNGERIGMITKFSKKGLMFDSWEGTLNTTQTGMNSGEPFEFSVDNDVNDPKVIATLDSAATNGWKVKVTYHQVKGWNWFNNRGETSYFATEVTVLDKNPIGNMFGNDNSSGNTSSGNQNVVGGRVIDTIYVVIQPGK